jgi:signal transduction histidine kinase
MNRCVLVIDDDLDTVSLISLVLEQENYQVVSTTKVEEGLKYFEQHHPAVLIMDLEMPSLHGVQVLKKIKPGIEKDFSVIIITGYGHDTNVKICYDLGVYAFLSKPVRLVELKGLVRNATLWEEYKLALKLHKEELEKLVEQRTNNLSQEIELRKNIEQQLVQANQIKDKIFKILTMDLRAPLSILLMNLQFLHENSRQISDSNLVQQISDVYTEARKTWQLTDNLFLWARCQKGEISVKPEICNLHSILNDIALSFSNLSSEKSLVLKIEAGKELVVKTDRMILNTILSNLISNAIKFSYPGGVITVKAETDDKQTQIVIQDNGTGISQDLIPFLTDVSRLLVTPGTANEKGTGLGLPVCKELVKIIGAEMQINSESGKGTTVSLVLPRG